VQDAGQRSRFSYARDARVSRTPSVRDATPGDEAILLEFLCALQEAERALCPSRRPGHEVDRLCYRELLEDGVQVLLAEVAGQPIGFVAGRLAVDSDVLQQAAWRPHGHVSDLYVVPARRGKGVARLLLEAMSGRLRGMGARRLTIGVLSVNEVAIKSYRRFGFEPFRMSLALDLVEPEGEGGTAAA
jgi:ribosomal protein S18 acetylase RimI-like enzyme